MARQSDRDRVNQWSNRMEGADKCFKKWSDRFRCEDLVKYYIGEQWASGNEDKYVINLCFPSVETKLPSLMYYRPQVVITPRPGRQDDAQTKIDERAQLQKDTLDTFLDDKEVGFGASTALSLKEAFPYFGIVEVGYTADYIDNPRAGQPKLMDDTTPVTNEDGSPFMEPDKIITDENLFVKRIPAKTFRCSISGKNELIHNDWCGYYEWHYTDDLKRNPRYKNTDGLKSTARISKDNTAAADENSDSDEARKKKGMVKLWKIWDIREMKRYAFIDGGEKFLQELQYLDPANIDTSDIEQRKRAWIFPFAVLKFHEIWDEFYPLPPMFNWIHPQNELNETREMQRVHRKRFYRRYGQLASVDDNEVKKLEDGGDGVRCILPSQDSLWPIPDAPLDSAIVRNIPLTKDDFREISAVSGEERGVSESNTATQAQIINVNSRIRDSYSRVQVGNWLSNICVIMLKTIRLRMELPIWVKVNVDPLGQFAGQEAMKVVSDWNDIQAEQLGDLSFDLSIDIETLSPVTEESKQQRFMQGLDFMINHPQIAFSDVLLRKTLRSFGITSAIEIAEIKRGCEAMLTLMQAQAQAKQGGSSASPAATPTNSSIASQIVNQLPVQ